MLVGAKVGVGVTINTRIVRISPTGKLFSSVILLRFWARISSWVELNWPAMDANVSPDCTLYSIRVPGSVSAGSGVGVGKVCPGAGTLISWPGKIGQVPSGKLLIASSVGKSTPNSSAIS